MKNTSSLKLNNDFRRLYSRGKSCAGAYVVVYALKTRRPVKRLGLTVGKSFGKAVKRNRMKRLMRESYRAIEGIIPDGYDFVIVARSRAIGTGFNQVKRDMEYVFKKLGLMELK